MAFLELQSKSLVIGLVSPVAWNVYEVGPSDMYLQVRQFFLHGYEPRGWLCCVRLRSLALTRKSLRFNVYISYNGCSFKDVTPSEKRMWKCLRIMDEMERRAGLYVITKRTRSGLSSVEASVTWRECLVLNCPCDIVNPLYFPLKEITVITTFVEIVNKFIGA